MQKDTGRKKKTWKEELWEWVKSLVIAFIMAMFIRTFFFQAFKIPSSSMHPTLQIGDHLIANKLIYRLREPKRGEIIIFRFPDNTKRDFVKRLVGLPGEKVEIFGGQIYINGKAVDDNRING
ncbi:MAG: signal peptidase I, partial [bacterium (Candidatus Ratteibacteria) CG23_combo_of_CG06-09_8_20_14_all_48_7]